MTRNEAIDAVNKACNDFIDDCPHCNARTHLVMTAHESHLTKNHDQYSYVIFRCKPCQKLVLKVFKFKQNPYSGDEMLEAEGWIAKYPRNGSEIPEKYAEFVPDLAISDYEEGLRCLAANSPRAAASMFRRSLQDALLDLGADQKQELLQQIKSTSRLTDDIKDWAHNIRIFGNWGAHPQEDLLKDVDIERAKEVKDFIEEFFNYVYVMPGKVAAARKAYEKKLPTGE